MRSPSLDFALRAILRMSQFAPGELVLRAQEKVPKEKGTQRPRRVVLQGRFVALPCVPRQAGGARNSEPGRMKPSARTCLEQGAHLDPGLPAVRGAAHGASAGTIGPRQALPSIAGISGLSESPCRAALASQNGAASAASSTSARNTEKRREPGQSSKMNGRASLRVRLSFGYFSLAKQRKVTRRQAETDKPSGIELTGMQRAKKPLDANRLNRRRTFSRRPARNVPADYGGCRPRPFRRKIPAAAPSAGASA